MLGVVVCVGVLSLGAWNVHANLIASERAPLVSIVWSGPYGTFGEPANTPGQTIARQLGGIPRTFSGTAMPGSPSGGGSNPQPGPRGPNIAQSFGVNVQPAPLQVTPTTESVILTRPPGRVVGGSFVGGLRTITVVATGSLAGWQASISLDALNSSAPISQSQLCVTPSSPSMVVGNPGDVVQANSHMCGQMGSSFPVFFAAPGGGGGTYSDTASLVLSVPAGIDASEITATLTMSVH
jgi:hypothetical protein